MQENTKGSLCCCCGIGCMAAEQAIKTEYIYRIFPLCLMGTFVGWKGGADWTVIVNVMISPYSAPRHCQSEPE